MWAEDGRFNVTTWNKWRWFVVVVVVFWLEELTTWRKRRWFVGVWSKQCL
jgi:hypothetical protein